MAIRHEVFGPNVLISVDDGEIKTESGFIIAAANSREAQGMAREEGIIEQLGDCAFDDIQPDRRPKIGDRVVIARYSGKTLGKYEDNRERRVVVDTGILAKIIEV